MNRLLGDCSLDVLRRRRGWKWTEYPPDVIPAWVAEMDFDLAEPIKDAVTQAIAAGDCGYPHPVGLGASYAGFARQRFGWAPDPALVYATPDVMTGVAEVLVEVTPHGSGVVINPPVYPPFFFRLQLAGRRVVEAPLARDAAGRYELDTDAVDRALAADDVAAYLLCSPHNPTGRVWSAGELATVAGICARRGAVLIVDEIHAPLALAGARHVPFLSLDLDAGLASVPWLDAVCEQLDENRTLLAKLIATHLPGVGYQPPEASFLAWLDCREAGVEDPAADILDRGRVAVNPGQDFGEQGRGFVRLNIGTSPALLEEIVRRMGTAFGAERPKAATR